MPVVAYFYMEGPVDRIHRPLDSAQPPVWRRRSHTEAVRLCPGNPRAVVPRRRAKALGERRHAQVFVKVWTLRVIQVVQYPSQFSLIAQRQLHCKFETLLKSNRIHLRSFAVSHRVGKMWGQHPLANRRSGAVPRPRRGWRHAAARRSEEHTSELQSPDHLVCRLLLEKKKKQV